MTSSDNQPLALSHGIDLAYVAPTFRFQNLLGKGIMAALKFQQNLFRMLLSVSISTLLLLLNCCQGQVVEEGTIRFDPPNSAREGTVEVFLDGVWGTISNDNLEESNVPTVICQQLGFDGEAKKMKGTVYYGPWNNPVWLVECPDSASSILDCERSKAETVDPEPIESAMALESDEPFEMFNHENDLGVFCEDPMEPGPPNPMLIIDIILFAVSLLFIVFFVFMAYRFAKKRKAEADEERDPPLNPDADEKMEETPFSDRPQASMYERQIHETRPLNNDMQSRKEADNSTYHTVQ